MSAFAPHTDRTSQRQAYGMAAALLLALLLSHWATIGHMVDRWTHDPQYSHGFVVPLFALIVLWSRRGLLPSVEWQPAWIGLALIGIGLALRFMAVQSDIDPLDAISLLPTAFGLVLLVGGWSVLGWSWPALAFLTFMMPLPFFIEQALAQPLRGVATEMSTYALQTLGTPASSEGNIILIDDMRLGVEEACSGLGMLMTFFALATALAMVVNAPLHDRLILIASAIPIAILANVIRITATGIAYHLAGKDSSVAQMIYHDLAGWLMMPLALGMLWVELKFLANVLIAQATDAPLPVKSFQAPSLGFPAGKKADAQKSVTTDG